MTALLLLAALAAPRNEVRADLGVASAVGFGGVTYTRTLSDRVSLEGGVGYGLSGMQFSAMPRLAFPAGGQAAFFVGLGPSLSVKRLDTGDVGGAFRRYGEGLWVNAEGGLHVTGRSGVTLSVSFGAAVGLWGNYMLREPQPFLSDAYAGIRGLVTPQGRIGLGYAF